MNVTRTVLTEVVGVVSGLLARQPPPGRVREKHFFTPAEKILLCCLGLAQVDGAFKPLSGVSAARIEIGIVRGGTEFSSLYDRTVAASDGDQNEANIRIWTFKVK